MIKGCKKNMIHIRSLGSPYFEEAYFIVRSGSEGGAGDEDILSEACRIADVTGDSYRRGRLRAEARRRSFFLYGASFCSLLFGLAMLIWG